MDKKVSCPAYNEGSPHTRTSTNESMSYGIPYLQFHVSSVNRNHFGTKFDTNCQIMDRLEMLLRELQEQRWFSHFYTPSPLAHRTQNILSYYHLPESPIIMYLNVTNTMINWFQRTDGKSETTKRSAESIDHVRTLPQSNRHRVAKPRFPELKMLSFLIAPDFLNFIYLGWCWSKTNGGVNAEPFVQCMQHISIGIRRWHFRHWRLDRSPELGKHRSRWMTFIRLGKPLSFTAHLQSSL